MVMILVHQRIENIDGVIMPNGQTHVVTAMIAGGVTSLILQQKNPKYTGGHTALAVAIGGVSGRLPDVIEPAINPNHRSFFHSYLIGFFLVYIGRNIYNFLIQKESEEVDEKKIDWVKVITFIVFIGIAAYIIHLLLDAFSRKGLPLIR